MTTAAGLVPFPLALLVLGATLAVASDRAASEAPGRWSTAKALAWQQTQPWIVGCNYVPSSAVNDVEMWQADGFRPDTIEREMGWARGLGLNSVRVFLNYVVWQADRDGSLGRFERFLAIAARHGISVMPVLLDDCAFAGKEPRPGRQDDPIPGVHNSGWVPSPGHRLANDRAAWPSLERYVKDVIGRFAGDRRVVVWDLYNEPGNSGMGDRSLPLVQATFSWAREARPSQPLTVGAWADFTSPPSRRMMELSDVISFHGYDAPEGVRAKVALCQEHGRPVLCTEWLNRGAGNTVAAVLPLFREAHVHCYNWGLVAGRTQTYMLWGSKPGDPMPALWQHDLFHPDGTPYSAGEVGVFAAALAAGSSAEGDLP